MSTPSPLMGKQRERRTRRSVRVADRVARWVISISGLGTILAVSGVLVFLVTQVVPLFLPASMIGEERFRVAGDPIVPYGAVDEDQRMGWRLMPNLTVQICNYSSGELLSIDDSLAKLPPVTAVSPSISRQTIIDDQEVVATEVLLGGKDGTVRLAQIWFRKEMLQLPTIFLDDICKYEPKRPYPYFSGLLTRTTTPGRYSHLQTAVTLGKPIDAPTAGAIQRIAFIDRTGGTTGCWQTAEGKFFLYRADEKKDAMGGVRVTTDVQPLAIMPAAGRPAPDDLRLSHDGKQVFLVWKDEKYQRVDVSDPAKPQAQNVRPIRPENSQDGADGQYLAVDEDRLLAWTMSSGGRLRTVRMDTGHVLEDRDLFPSGPPMTVHSLPTERSLIADGKKYNFKEVAFGFLDGSVRVIRFRLRETFPPVQQLPRHLVELDEGEIEQLGGGLVLRTPSGNIRITELVLETTPPLPPASGELSPLRRLDQIKTSSGSSVCYLDEADRLWLTVISEKQDRGDGSIRREIDEAVQLPFTAPSGKGRPDHLLFLSGADQILPIWNDGTFQRFDVRQPKSARVAESGNLLPSSGLKITQVNQLIGRSTLLVGDSDGVVHAWFLVNTTEPRTTDGKAMVRGHRLPGPDGSGAVAKLSVSDRTRLLAIGYASHRVRVVNVTSEKIVVDIDTESQVRPDAMALLPKENGLLLLRGDEGRLWKFDARHPEITLRSLFLPVWYEGSEAPVHKWEASSGTDEYEPKYGMGPLIFGTLKATVYSLLFGVPLALLAAIYTSEFMAPRTKALIKPTIEMMASLPSVVLGFLAGLVFAVFIENVVPTVLMSFLTVPVSFVLFARLWQLLPSRVGLILSRHRFLMLIPAAATGFLAATLLGPAMERWFFQGDIRGWLSSRGPDTRGGWLFLLLPLSVMVSVFLSAGIVTPVLRRITGRWTRTAVAWMEIARFLVMGMFTVGLACALAAAFENFHLDARGTFIGQYSQRNALVVGFVMGFAIIPIIYTIADDALSAVPAHLRSGSLACGATPWQTTTRIVIPTAMSGIFSAIMIGMGRAIGETMIVVMATGNTPVMDWNIFSGFRTLSANIAVEMPEAVKNSTHYRTLFLAALILFAMTFVLNTIAEVVRLRFRRRAYQL